MRYQVAVTIHKGIDEVLKEFQSKEAAFKWIDGLKEFNLLEGEMEQEGSKYEMVLESKGKTQKMIETLLKLDPPSNITTKYELGKVENICINKFHVSGENTIYTMDTEFIFPFPQNILMALLRPMFKAESKKGLYAFRDYVESKEK